MFASRRMPRTSRSFTGDEKDLLSRFPNSAPWRSRTLQRVARRRELFNSFRRLTRCKGKDRTASAATEVTSARERSERRRAEVSTEKKADRLSLSANDWTALRGISPHLAREVGWEEAEHACPCLGLCCWPAQAVRMDASTVRESRLTRLGQPKSRLLPRDAVTCTGCTGTSCPAAEVPTRPAQASTPLRHPPALSHTHPTLRVQSQPRGTPGHGSTDERNGAAMKIHATDEEGEVR